MLNSIIAGVLSGIANIVMGIFSAKQAKENEYKVVEHAARNASFKNGKDMELKIMDVQSNVPVMTRASDFRKAFAAVSIFFLVFLTGCVAAKVVATTEGYKPVIKIKKAPKTMFDGPEELTPREKEMATYILVLRAAIGRYNYYARMLNEKNGYPSFDEPKDSNYEIPLLSDKVPVDSETKKAEVVPDEFLEWKPRPETVRL